MGDGPVVERIGERTVLLIEETGPPLGIRELLDGAVDAEATVLACPVARIDPAFFELRTGVAGEILQRLVNYRILLAVVGELPPAARASRSLAALVREADRGRVHWFVRDLDELRARLAAVSDPPEAATTPPP